MEPRPLSLALLVALSVPSPAQTAEAPRVPRPDCPVPGFATIGERSGFASGDFVLALSEEWLVFQQNVDVSLDEYSEVRLVHVPTGIVHSTGLRSELAFGVAAAYTGAPYGFVFQSVSESEAQADLNGDGDLIDHVLHSFDLRTARVLNLGIAVGFSLRQSGPSVACLVEEESDENGDGDIDDRIVYAGDLDSGFVTSSGVASNGDPNALRIDGTRAGWLVPEGPGGDLNGDGDDLDDVRYVHDFALGAGLSLGLAGGSSSALAGNVYAFTVAEAAQGADLNGDGDQNDEVVHVLRFAPFTLRNVGLAGTGLLVDGGKVAFRQPATSHAIVVDVASGVATDLGFAVVAMELVDHRLVLSANEGATDRNGDGDTLDRILWVHDLASGTTVPVPRATEPGIVADFDGTRLLFTTDEAGHGATDLNGDGDALDRVWTLWDAGTGALRNLRWARSDFGTGGLFGGFAALSVDAPGIGPAWVDVRTDGIPAARFVGSGPLIGAPFLVDDLGVVGEQFTASPPTAVFRVVTPCD